MTSSTDLPVQFVFSVNKVFICSIKGILPVVSHIEGFSLSATLTTAGDVDHLET